MPLFAGERRKILAREHVNPNHTRAKTDLGRGRPGDDNGDGPTSNALA